MSSISPERPGGGGARARADPSPFDKYVANLTRFRRHSEWAYVPDDWIRDYYQWVSKGLFLHPHNARLLRLIPEDTETGTYDDKSGAAGGGVLSRFETRRSIRDLPTKPGAMLKQRGSIIEANAILEQRLAFMDQTARDRAAHRAANPKPKPKPDEPKSLKRKREGGASAVPLGLKF